MNEEQIAVLQKMKENIHLLNLYQGIFLAEKYFDKIKIVSSVGLNIKACDIQDIKLEDDEVILVCNPISLMNINSPLPTDYVEDMNFLLKEKDYALKDFLDIFNQRIVELFYKTNKNIVPAHLDLSSDHDVFSDFYNSLKQTDDNNNSDFKTLNYWKFDFLFDELNSLSDVYYYSQHVFSQYLTNRCEIEVSYLNDCYLKHDCQGVLNAKNQSVQVLGNQMLQIDYGIDIFVKTYSAELYDMLLEERNAKEFLKNISQNLKNSQPVRLKVKLIEGEGKNTLGNNLTLNSLGCLSNYNCDLECQWSLR